MKRKLTSRLLLATAAVTGLALAQGRVAEDASADITSASPADVIAARQALMFAIEDLMQPIDTYTVDGGAVDVEEVDREATAAALTASATTIAAMLQATPHLFPPATNLYDPDSETPATLALPAIWEDFSVFYTMAQSAVATATTMAETKDTQALVPAAVALRASCDACHAVYLKPYVPSGVTQEDLDFDFDSIFQ